MAAVITDSIYSSKCHIGVKFVKLMYIQFNLLLSPS